MERAMEGSKGQAGRNGVFGGRMAVMVRPCSTKLGSTVKRGVMGLRGFK